MKPETPRPQLHPSVYVLHPAMRRAFKGITTRNTALTLALVGFRAEHRADK